MIKKTLIAIVIITTLVSGLPQQPAAALSGSEFQGGRIVDDSMFFNGSAISAQDIQLFLNSKVPVCDTMGQQMRAV